MKELIGANAGIVWEFLNENGNKTIKEIKAATKLTEKDLYAALGWLAREEKIELTKADKDYTVTLL
ncbi:MAG: winged helix-turn-helix domain-containing protein [Dysgonomonas sp.]